MEFLIEGLSDEEQKEIFAGACGIKSCTSFICDVFTDPCKAVCSGVGCGGGFECGDFTSE